MSAASRVNSSYTLIPSSDLHVLYSISIPHNTDCLKASNPLNSEVYILKAIFCCKNLMILTVQHSFIYSKHPCGAERDSVCVCVWGGGLTFFAFNMCFSLCFSWIFGMKKA